MSLSDTEEDWVLNNFVANRLSGTKYIALFNGAPLDDGSGGTEMSGNAYARAVAPAWGASSGGVVLNTASCTFPAPTPADWGIITHWAIFDASSGGNLILWGELDSPVDTSVGNPPVFQVGDIQISCD